ncbi:unnamed protein product [Pocillopora meandrina]|uniref:Uncharacterized protein n=1 Tax=Pocillopora meandrina TaxID=46732 RepID=A0AAU9WXW6_9CNID|nr:unnamed protein product [Pocillopora meandrina]
MDSSMNGHLPQERFGDEEVPLILLSSDLDRRQRAKALSQLSHQSQGSNVYDIGHDEVSVTMTTTISPPFLCTKALVLLFCFVLLFVYLFVYLLCCSEDINLLDKLGRSPLHNAILGRHVKIMEMLFGAGAKIYLLDESQDSPLHTAVRTGDENFVRTLLRFGRCDANIRGHSSGTALHIAADMVKVAICRILVKEVSLPDLFVQASQLLEANKIFLIFDELSQKKLTIFLIVRIKLMKVFWTSRVVQLCLDSGAIIRQPKVEYMNRQNLDTVEEKRTVDVHPNMQYNFTKTCLNVIN